MGLKRFMLNMARTARASGALLLAAAATACAAQVDAGAGEAPPPQLGQAFVLKAGQSVAVAGTANGLVVGFDRVLADSRCPKGERCIWAGDAVALVWLAPADGPRTTGELHTAPGQPQVLTAGGHSLQLVRLDPAPISGRTHLPGSVRATLVLHATSAAPLTDRQ